ncbi:MAG TPA: hypothetical protein VGH81_12840 [Rudaea sp.]|jgi:hypothetical protein
MTSEHKAPSLDGKKLRFHFSDGPMKGKDFDHTFHGEKVDWGAAGSDKMTTSEGKLIRIGEDCYVGSYMGPNGFTLTTAMNLASGKLFAFASDGKEWSEHNGTVKQVA